MPEPETPITSVKTISPKLVTVRDRKRKFFSKNALDDLEASIKKLGQLQPGVCMIGENEELLLCAGERRLRACEMLGIPFSYILREEINDPVRLREIELEENLRRESLTWHEECSAIEDLHKIWCGRDANHTKEKTAELLGISRAGVSSKLEIATFAKELPNIRDLKSESDARKAIEKIKESYSQKIALEAAVKKHNLGFEQKDPLVRELAAVSAGEKLTAAEPIADDDPERERKIQERAELVAEFDREMEKKRVSFFYNRFLCGRMEDELAKDKGEPFSVIFFDPPWGVSYDENKTPNESQEDYEDKPSYFDENIDKWLSLLYEKAAQDSHLYLVFPITRHGQVYDALERTGWRADRIPLIWHKKGAHVTRNPKTKPGRCYEPIAFAIKGKREIKACRLGAADIIETPMPTQAMKKLHPSAKHPALWVELLLRSARPGERVLDPMSGSGFVALACEFLRKELSLDWLMIEEKEVFRNQGLFACLQGMTAVMEAQVAESSSPPVASDFKTLDPGSQAWMAYWKAHPEDQDQMIAWRKESGK